MPQPFSKVFLAFRGIFYYDWSMDKPLDDAVKEFLAANRGVWAAISDDAKVSHSWLSKFVNGHIRNPGLTTLRKVHEAIERHQKARA